MVKKSDEQQPEFDLTRVLAEYVDPADPSMVKVEGKRVTVNRTLLTPIILEEFIERLNSAGYEVFKSLGSPR